MNRPGDIDTGWSVEMAIPLRSLRFWGDKPPADGSKWRINFSRVEWDRDVVNGQYVPRLRPGGKRRLPEHNWVWSPQGIIDMHAPEKWGYLQFSSHNGGGDTVAYVPPADEALRAVLWKVYYAQKGYFRQHGKYAATLTALGMEAPELWMKATDLQFTAGTGAGLNIDQDGLVARAGAGR